MEVPFFESVSQSLGVARCQNVFTGRKEIHADTPVRGASPRVGCVGAANSQDTIHFGHRIATGVVVLIARRDHGRHAGIDQLLDRISNGVNDDRLVRANADICYRR